MTKKFLVGSILFWTVAISVLAGFLMLNKPGNINGAPPYDTAFDDPPTVDKYAWITNWKRPDGPVRVGLQAGHWKNNELPDELERLRGNTGSSGGGKSEWEVNLMIAQETAEVLKKYNIVVDILPSTVPVKYIADAFVAIHADGNLDPKVSGFKVAASRYDYTNLASNLANRIQDEYGKATELVLDPNVTRNMRGYYAFAWWRREHAVHPMTPAVILETGFLTSPQDRKIIVSNQKKAAEGIAKGIVQFLTDQNLIEIE